MENKKLRLLVLAECLLSLVLASAIRDCLIAKALLFRVTYGSVSALAIWGVFELLRQYWTKADTRCLAKIARIAQTITFCALVIFIGIQLWPSLVKYDQDCQRQNSEEIKLLEGLTWRVLAVDKDCWTGTRNHYTVTITFEPVDKGKWKDELPYVEFEDNGGWRTPDLWRKFLADDRPPFRIKIDDKKYGYYASGSNTHQFIYGRHSIALRPVSE